jgi:two-component system OmpR family response regulator
VEAKQRILVVDDDAEMVASLQDILQQAGFDTDGAANGAQMLAHLARHDYALVLLDLRLKSEDGLTLARDLRQRSAVPIIMISGASDETDRVLLLEVAADDFLVKPFSPRELVARIRAVLRRVGALPERPPERAVPARKPRGDVAYFGQWVMDFDNRELSARDGRLCPLTRAEYRLLEAFVRHPRRIWTRDQLLEQTRGLETEVFDRTIDVLILRLRRKIEPNPKQPQFICTEHGIGYVFAADVSRE